MNDLPTESYSRVTDNCPCVDPSCVRLARHVFVWPERAVTVNELIRMHWRKVADFTARWRQAFGLMAKGCEPLAWCNVTVQYVHGTDRKIDVAAEALAVKAALDGIVDGGVLPDDNPEFVKSVKFLPATYMAGEERLIITIEGPVTAFCVHDADHSMSGELCDICRLPRRVADRDGALEAI